MVIGRPYTVLLEFVDEEIPVSSSVGETNEAIASLCFGFKVSKPTLLTALSIALSMALVGTAHSLSLSRVRAYWVFMWPNCILTPFAFHPRIRPPLTHAHKRKGLRTRLEMS